MPPLSLTASVAPGEAPSIPGLLIEAPIGRGGFATVWRARQCGDEAPLALKVGRGDNPVAIERFRRDAEAIRRVGPPFAPRLLSEGRLPDGRPYIVMDLCPGKTLASRLEELRSPP